MTNLGIGVLPHITNALLVASIFPAESTYTYCVLRSLYGVALAGRPPAFLERCTKNGISIYCSAVAMPFSCAFFLILSNGSATVLSWLLYVAWIGLTGITLVVLLYRYSSFEPFSVSTFFTYYTMVIVGIRTSTGRRIFKRTKVVPAHEADLVWIRPSVDAYESRFDDDALARFQVEVLQMFGFSTNKTHTQPSDCGYSQVVKSGRGESFPEARLSLGKR
ncbi:hypothetical protein B9Z65_1399 [Elsinoe australis]|uniref:Amino acid permease/ SLC12A domain-containing protein n=1 Tax=Elsinoe australis TaxID=40998 RepID=A0A2P7YFS7_9PEZI|nr:hypothetical protein B9Z65_1399 [Elsinoe australis]